MSRPEPTRRLFNIIAAAIFIMGTAMFSYMAVADWLPALFLILGCAITIRQLLQGKTLDVIVCFIVFGGCFFSSFFGFVARIFLPTFLILGSIYYLLRQFFEFDRTVKDKVKDKDLSASEYVHEKEEAQHFHRH
jgi:hypothetical protein